MAKVPRNVFVVQNGSSIQINQNKQILGILAVYFGVWCLAAFEFQHTHVIWKTNLDKKWFIEEVACSCKTTNTMTRRLAIKNHSPSSNAFVCFLSTRDVDITRTFDGNHKCVINTCLFVGKSKRRFDIFLFSCACSVVYKELLVIFL